MKQTRLLVLILLTIVGAVAAAVTPPTDLSLRGIVEWVGVGGHIASGTSTILPPVGAVGSRYTHLYNASKPIEYRSTGTAWRQMWTWNHSQLSNLEYVLSGHGIVPISYGGTGATNTADALRYLGAEPASTCIRADGSDPDAAWIDFVATDTKPAFAAGRLFWDTDDECLSFYGAATDTINQVGQEMWIHVKNPGVATLTNGSVIYMTHPDTGKEPCAYLAQANSSDTSRVIGVCTHDIPPDSTGVATIFGLVRDVNTAGMTPGEKVYLSATTPGSFSMTVPDAPATSMLVGYVMKAHATAGVIYVRLQLNGALARATFWDDVYMNDTVTFATAPVFTAPLQTREALGFPDSTGRANYVLSVGTNTDELYWAAPGAGTSEAGRNMVVWDELNLRSGTHTQTEFSPVQLRMNQIPGRMSDYPSVKMSEFIRGYLLQLENVAGVYPASGSYLCAQKDLGAVKNCSLDSVFEATLGSGTATFEYRISSDGSAWTDWTEVSPTTVECRYMEFRASLTSTDPAQTPTITSFLETVKLLGLDAYGSGCQVYALDGLLGGTWVPFGYTFTSTPSVVLNAVGSGTYAGIVSTTNQGFYVSVKDSSGAFINGVIDWIAKGY